MTSALSQAEARPLYRPEIDGLRAAAIAGVVLFHGGFGVPGGYAGVDVFFVISGFLITNLILSDLQRGRFSFADFWERRARRIIPALFVVTLATLIIGWQLLLPSDLVALGESAAMQAGFAANVHYWRYVGYFAVSADEQPLLHTWSLAVEEQFYLVVPVALWLMFRARPSRWKAVTVVALTGGFLASLALSIYAVPRSPVAAFYLLPTRAWELLLGSMLVFFPSEPLRVNRSHREILAATGAALVLATFVFYEPTTPFPGLAALTPCLGTALLIVANGRITGAAPTIVGKALSLRPVVFIGLLSYSLYLWHWPLLAFDKYVALAPRPPSHRLFLIGAAVCCAVLSWKYVESPFRRRLDGSRTRIFALSATALAIVFGAGMFLKLTDGVPRRFTTQQLRFSDAASDTAFYNDLSTADVLAGRLVPLGVADPDVRPTVLVWGDSHAMAMLPAIDELLKERGLSGRAATRSATVPLAGWYGVMLHGLNEQSLPFGEAVLSYVRNEKVTDVILNAQWSGYVHRPTDQDNLGQALVKTVRRLTSAGARVWIVLDVPAHRFNVPRALARNSSSISDLAVHCTRPANLDRYDGISPDLLKQVEDAGGRVLDPKPLFLDSAKQHYVVERNGTALYRDSHHLSVRGAKLVLLPFLREKLTIAKRRSGRT